MPNLEMIEALCTLVEHQASVIRHLALNLAEARNLTEAEQRMIESTKKEYEAFLGTDECQEAE